MLHVFIEFPTTLKLSLSFTRKKKILSSETRDNCLADMRLQTTICKDLNRSGKKKSVIAMEKGKEMRMN